MARHKDVDWNIPNPISITEHACLAALMDVRDELKKLNRVLTCPNFLTIPRTLNIIATQTKPRRRRRKTV